MINNKVNQQTMNLKRWNEQLTNREIKVGIIAAPERAENISDQLIDQLADLFHEHINRQVNWVVDQVTDPLAEAAEAAQNILYNAADVKKDHEWDYAICLTDLPLFHDKDSVVANLSFGCNVAQISIPIFGFPPLKKNIRTTIIRLLAELYQKDNKTQVKPYHSSDSRSHIQTKSPFGLNVLKRYVSIMPPIRRKENQSSDTHATQNETHDPPIDVQFIIYPRINGRIRLIFGMTFANHPMKIMASFKHVIAIAFATGIFALIFPTIWDLGQVYSVYRLGAMMFAAIMGMVAWIIVVHHLWEHPSKQTEPHFRKLYNTVTTSTLIIDVLTYYTVIFILFFIACLVLIPVDYFEAMIHDTGQSIIIKYMRVAWAEASIATIVSAIGAGFEDDQLVRNLTYGYRQKDRSSK